MYCACLKVPVSNNSQHSKGMREQQKRNDNLCFCSFLRFWMKKKKRKKKENFLMLHKRFLFIVVHLLNSFFPFLAYLSRKQNKSTCLYKQFRIEYDIVLCLYLCHISRSVEENSEPWKFQGNNYELEYKKKRNGKLFVMEIFNLSSEVRSHIVPNDFSSFRW